MNEWMNKWLNEWMNEWMNKWLNESINEWINEWANAWINEWTNYCNNTKIKAYQQPTQNSYSQNKITSSTSQHNLRASDNIYKHQKKHCTKLSRLTCSRFSFSLFLISSTSNLALSRSCRSRCQKCNCSFIALILSDLSLVCIMNKIENNSW